MAIVRLRDIMSAEERYDDALEALARARDPDNWAAHESVDRDGRRTLHVGETQFRREESLEADVAAAEHALRRLQRAFAAGGDV